MQEYMRETAIGINKEKEADVGINRETAIGIDKERDSYKNR